MDDRHTRAASRRKTAILRKTTLSEAEAEFVPLCGPEAVSLVARLTRESYAEAGIEIPAYSRRETPYRFVPWA